MLLDYSEKRGARESVERKPVQKNRPRKEPAVMFALLAVAALIFTFGAGVLAGWFLFSGGRRPAPVTAAALAAKKESPAPAHAQPIPAGPDAPLTFYKTLPDGGKGSMGTGLNLTKKPEHARTAPVAAPPAPAPAAAGSDEEKPEASARFVVQVASYRDKAEAEAAQSKLAGKGVAAYLVESKLADKGVWYRIRVGRHLTKAEAGELALKSGKGSIVLPE